MSYRLVLGPREALLLLSGASSDGVSVDRGDGGGGGVSGDCVSPS